MVPEIGGGREKAVLRSIRAMGELAEALERRRPQVLCIVSPHGESLPSSMGVVTSKSIVGTLAMWSPEAADVRYRFSPDQAVVQSLQQECRAAGIALGSLGNDDYELDHGVMVPMYFLAQKVRDVPLVVLSFCALPLQLHYEFGKAVRRAADATGKRVAFIASGDLSHRLIPQAPAGYDPMGKVFDQKVVQALERLDAPAVLNLNRELVDRAGECGLRSFTILLGVLDGLRVKGKMLSYEGPFGVGYPVASYEVDTDGAAGAGGQAGN